MPRCAPGMDAAPDHGGCMNNQVRQCAIFASTIVYACGKEHHTSPKEGTMKTGISCLRPDALYATIGSVENMPV